MASRVTQKDMYSNIAEFLTVAEAPVEMVEFIERKIDELNRKAAKAEERRRAKKAEAVDEYEAIVAGALTNELQSGEQVYAAVGDEDFSLGKVRARLTKLVKNEVAVKENFKVGSRTVVGYRLAD